MGQVRNALVVLAAGALLAGAACSRDDDAGTDTGSGSTVATVPDVTIAPAKAFTLAEPVKIVSLISDPSVSTDPNAIADFNDGAKMAVEEINQAGGIGGHPVQLEIVETPVLGDGALNALNEALAKNPDAILGPVSSSAALAIAPRVAEAQVPVLQNTTDPQLALGASAGNEWMFATRPLNDAAAEITGKFVVEELDAQNVGLMSTSSSFGQQGAAGIKAGVAAAGGTIGAERTFEFNATDLVEPILAMSGVDAVIDWGTPNTLTLAVTTLNQQGLGDKPHIGPGSVAFQSFVDGVGDPSLLDNLYGAVDCNPIDDPRDTTQAWIQRFQAEYGYTPVYSSAELYDSVFMLRNVIETAESAEPAAIRDGLKGLDWSGGVCAKRYVNQDNVLIHQTVLARYVDGKLTTVKEYEGI